MPSNASLDPVQEDNTKNDIEVGECTQHVRRTIAENNLKKHENGYDTNGSVGPFHGAVEHESSGNESSVVSSPDCFEGEKEPENYDVNDEDDGIPPIGSPIIDSNYLWTSVFDNSLEPITPLVVKDVLKPLVKVMQDTHLNNKMTSCDSKKINSRKNEESH